MQQHKLHKQNVWIIETEDEEETKLLIKQAFIEDDLYIEIQKTKPASGRTFIALAKVKKADLVQIMESLNE